MRKLHLGLEVRAALILDKGVKDPQELERQLFGDTLVIGPSGVFIQKKGRRPRALWKLPISKKQPERPPKRTPEAKAKFLSALDEAKRAMEAERGYPATDKEIIELLLKACAHKAGRPERQLIKHRNAIRVLVSRQRKRNFKIPP
jgi:hypothetical protein